MDNNLFSKHIQAITKRNTTKQAIGAAILKATGVELREDEFDISEKEIRFNISSVKRTELTKKGVEAVLQKFGMKSR